MRDVKFVEMKAILDFIYKGEAYVTQENIQGVLKTAEALKVTGKIYMPRLCEVMIIYCNLRGHYDNSPCSS